MRSIAKPANTVRLLCLGASTTQQITQETEDTWCGILETKVRAIHGVDFHALSIGWGGAKVVDSAQWLLNYIDKLKPDIIITLFGINDLAWSGGSNYTPRHVIEPEQGRSMLSRLYRWCLDYSQICRRVDLARKGRFRQKEIQAGRAVGWHTANLPDFQRRYKELPYVESPIRQPDPIDEFRDSIRWLFRFAAQRGVKLIALGQPTLWKPDPTPEELGSFWFSVNTPDGPVRPSMSWLVAEMDKYNAIQKAEAEALGFDYVDLAAAVPRTLDYFFDDCHFTDKGSEKVAAVVLPTLLRTLSQLPNRK